MSLLNRAWLYITRKRGRSILLFLIMLITAVFTMLGLAIKASADEEASAVRKSLGSSFTVEEDTFAIWALMESYKDGYIPLDERPKQLSIELMDRITEMEHITYYFTSSSMHGAILDLKPRPGWRASVYEEGLTNPDFLRQNSFDLDEYAVRKQCLDLYACNNTAFSEYFRTGAFTLTEGRHINADDTFKALISSDLAERNGLSVGDTFNFEIREGISVAGGDLNKRWGDPFTLEIVGVFDINLHQETSTYELTTGETLIRELEWDYAENYIFCDLNTAVYEDAVSIAYYRYTVGKDETFDAARIENATLDNYSFIKATFFVDYPENLNAAIAEFKTIDDIDFHYYPITPDESAYKASVKPLTALGTFSAVLIAAVIAGCAVILGLLLNMWIKSRRREMGVLMSMGVSKRTIVLQLLLETMVLAVLALILGVCLSGFLAGPVGNMAEKIVSPKGTADTYAFKTDMFLRPYIDVTSAEPVDLSYGLSAANILITAIVIVVSAIGSVLVTSWNIMKLNPKHVLTRH